MCQIPRRCGDISPHFSSILIPRPDIKHIAMPLFCHHTFHMLRMFEKKWLNQGQYPERLTVHLKCPDYDGEEFFYQRPLPPLWSNKVNRAVQTTTVTKYSLVATRVKKRTSCQITLIMVAWSFLRVIPPRKRGFVVTIMSDAKKKKSIGYKKSGLCWWLIKEWKSAQTSWIWSLCTGELAILIRFLSGENHLKREFGCNSSCNHAFVLVWDRALWLSPWQWAWISKHQCHAPCGPRKLTVVSAAKPASSTY